jgi:DNA-binding IclR family transcriptional regulator
MKPDPDYIKRLLVAFQDAPEPTTDIEELKQQGLSYEDSQFYFHLRLLRDQGFVEREDGEYGLGVQTMSAGNHSWSIVPLRLTASGHEFAEAMGHSKAFAAVKSSLVTSSLSIMRDVAVAAFKTELSRHGISLGL